MIYYMGISARNGQFSDLVYESGVRRSAPSSSLSQIIYSTPNGGKTNTQSFGIDQTRNIIYVSDYNRSTVTGYYQGFLRRLTIDGGPAVTIASVQFPTSLHFGDPLAEVFPFTAMMEQVVYQDRIYFSDVKKPGLHSIGVDGLGRVSLWDGTTRDGYFWSAYFIALAPSVSKIFFTVLPANSTVSFQPDSNLFWIPMTGGEATRIPAAGSIECLTIDNDNGLLIAVTSDGTTSYIKQFDFNGNSQTLITITPDQLNQIGLFDSIVVEPGPLPGAAPAVGGAISSFAGPQVLLVMSVVVALCFIAV